MQRLDTAASGFLNKSSGTVYPQTTTAYNRSLSVDLAKPFEWGGTLDLNYKPLYSYQKGSIQDYPAAGDTYTWSTQDAYTGSFAATYTQSLLQGFGTRVARVPLVIARRNAEAADYTFQLAIIGLMAQVESDYWKVVSTERILASKKISLQLARKLLDENLIKLKVGTMAPLDVTSAEAQVAKAEQDIISAEADLANAKDTLVRDLYPNAERPAALELTDAPTLGHIRLDRGRRRADGPGAAPGTQEGQGRQGRQGPAAGGQPGQGAAPAERLRQLQRRLGQLHRPGARSTPTWPKPIIPAIPWASRSRCPWRTGWPRATCPPPGPTCAAAN